VTRRIFIAGNWKMNTRKNGAVELAEAIATGLGETGNVSVAVCPPSVYLAPVGEALHGSRVALGAQDVYREDDGAFTGELSTGMLLDLGCQYVILGHSERRHVLGETNEDVNQKVLAALAAGLSPIVCVGEKLEEREADRTQDIVEDQLRGSLADVPQDKIEGVVIAYEPVWAIGTGKVATTDQAQEVHAGIRRWLSDQYNADVASQIVIQYGGSVKPDNAGDLLAQADIDGALVGGASLKADSFLGIIQSAGQSGA